jgi:hypothetical protein
MRDAPLCLWHWPKTTVLTRVLDAIADDRKGEDEGSD